MQRIQTEDNLHRADNQKVYKINVLVILRPITLIVLLTLCE